MIDRWQRTAHVLEVLYGRRVGLAANAPQLLRQRSERRVRHLVRRTLTSHVLVTATGDFLAERAAAHMRGRQMVCRQHPLLKGLSEDGGKPLIHELALHELGG